MHNLDRRQLVKTMGLGGLFYTVRGAFAQALTLTPEQTLGPYYPDRLPLDQDNDLLLINDSITPAVGEVAWVSGRILSSSGQPVRGATVEIWQADNGGAYIHSASPITPRDAGFQGYGKFQTASSGEYLFRTVKPGLYPGRTRHIHMLVTFPGGTKLTTQLYVEGESRNASDGVLNGIRDTAARSSVIVPWTAVEGSRIGELAATFDVIAGYTPSDNPTPERPTLVSFAGAVNSASYYPGVTPGALVTIFGNGLSSTSRQWSGADIVDGKLPASLDGVSVLINNKPAAVSYVSPTQVNVQAPADTGSGPVQVTVTNENGTSNAISAQTNSVMPAFFQASKEYVAGLRADGSSLGAETAVSPGETVVLYGTGFGATNPEMPAGEVIQGSVALANAVTIRVHNQIAVVNAAGLVAAGLYRFEVFVPELADGDYSVTAEVGGVRTQKVGRLRVRKA